MKKLALNLEDLQIETFEPEARAWSESGTVEARELTVNCLQTYDPHNYECVLLSPDEINGNCTPVCYTYAYYCTQDPEVC